MGGSHFPVLLLHSFREEGTSVEISRKVALVLLALLSLPGVQHIPLHQLMLIHVLTFSLSPRLPTEAAGNVVVGVTARSHARNYSLIFKPDIVHLRCQILINKLQLSAEISTMTWRPFMPAMAFKWPWCLNGSIISFFSVRKHSHSGEKAGGLRKASACKRPKLAAVQGL